MAALILTEKANPRVMDSITTWASEKLPRYAIPLFVRVAETLPVTGTHKHAKHVLRDAGVSPGNAQCDQIYWLQNRTYVPFRVEDWERLKAGRVKL